MSEGVNHPLVKDHAVTQPSVGTKQQIRFLAPIKIRKKLLKQTAALEHFELSSLF